MTFKPSKYQQVIYDWITNDSGNAIIQAVAGSGKTSTIVQSTNYIPSNKTAVFVAFNKSIATELSERLPKHIQSKTLHSLGLSMFRNNVQEFDMSKAINSGKVDILINNELQSLQDWEKSEYFIFLKRIIPLIKNMLVDYTKLEEITDLMAKFNINDFEVDDRAMTMIRNIIHNNNQQLTTIDFDDMIYLPVVKNFNCFKYDWVFVDEVQDLNKTQFELIKKICNINTRVIAVGDERQSIYAFRGADTNSMSNFKEYFKAKSLPLSICYRCPKSHIMLAKEIVPEIEWADDANEGEVLYHTLQASLELMKDTDLVLCRTNAPLVKVAFALIRNGKKAIVRGRDIGKGLITLIKKYKVTELAELYMKLENFRKLQEEKLDLIEKGKLDANKKQIILNHIDSVETLITIMEDCSSIQEVISKIETIFSDDKEGIICTSIHRAKGLECDNSFILNRERMPHPMAKTDEEIAQEINIIYVALTRAKKTLCLVKGIIK